MYIHSTAQYGGGPDGALSDVVSPDRLYALPRNEVNGAVTTVSGTTMYTFFTALRSGVATAIASWSAGTAAATPTSTHMGLYREEANGDLTLVGSHGAETLTWAATETRYSKTFTTPVQVSQGVRYACAALFVGTTAPTLVGSLGSTTTVDVPMGAIDFINPKRSAVNASETTLPASVVVASLAAGGAANVGRVYFEVAITV